MTPSDQPDDHLLQSLWGRPPEADLADLLPARWREVPTMKERLKAHLDRAPRIHAGTVDPAAIVRGEIVQLGPGSVIEAGAIVHESCRLALGANSRLRSSSLVRGDVVIGPDCTIGAYCEVVRSLILGGTALGHWVFVGDSIIGADNMLAGAVFVANSSLHEGRTIRVTTPSGKWDSGVTHLGVLSGDGVRMGVAILTSPGSVVLPGLTLPPQAVLHGVVDAPRAERLMQDFRARWLQSPEE